MTAKQEKAPVRLDVRRGTAVIEVETRLYPLEAVLGAAYVFVDRCYLRVERAGRGRLAVRLKRKEGAAPDREALEALVGEFENELLHHALRDRLQRTRGRLREYLVARALLSAEEEPPRPAPGGDRKARAAGAADGSSPLERDGPGDDYLDDPLGIAVPWEERYGGDEPKSGGDGADA